jgi:hypothetical protein
LKQKKCERGGGVIRRWLRLLEYKIKNEVVMDSWYVYIYSHVGDVSGGKREAGKGKRLFKSFLSWTISNVTLQTAKTSSIHLTEYKELEYICTAKFQAINLLPNSIFLSFNFTTLVKFIVLQKMNIN